VSSNNIRYSEEYLSCLYKSSESPFAMDGENFLMDQQVKFENDDFEEEIYDEDRYDALNDETFGNDMSDGDWEADHEKYAKFDEGIKNRWPDGTEIIDDIPNSIASEKTNVFSESLKSLPDLERELRELQMSNSCDHYDIPLSFSISK